MSRFADNAPNTLGGLLSTCCVMGTLIGAGAGLGRGVSAAKTLYYEGKTGVVGAAATVLDHTLSYAIWGASMPIMFPVHVVHEMFCMEPQCIVQKPESTLTFSTTIDRRVKRPRRHRCTCGE